MSHLLFSTQASTPPAIQIMVRDANVQLWKSGCRERMRRYETVCFCFVEWSSVERTGCNTARLLLRIVSSTNASNRTARPLPPWQNNICNDTIVFFSTIYEVCRVTYVPLIMTLCYAKHHRRCHVIFFNLISWIAGLP